MDRNPAEPTDRDRLLDDVLAGYFEAAEAGRAPDRRGLIDRYPSLAAELETFFADEDRLDRLAAPLRAAARAGLTRAAAGEPVARPFGRYTLVREVGRGAMGVVYEAEQDHPRRHVALKMMRDPGGASAADAARFKNEAQAAADLDHPNVVPVYEVGECEGQPYFTMKYLAGSLAEHLPRFAEDPRAAARLVAAVARAVHHAHQRGVLHRDLKPSNVLLDGEGRPHVADFGLAKRLESDAELTQSGALVGTPNYMAPEQAAGRRGAVTTATDVYGLGAVLYALLTGRPPSGGGTVLDVLERVRTRDPDPPRRLNPRVGRDLQTVCLRCLEKDPARRYASAAELADDLDRWLAGEPVRARPVGRLARLGRWCRRNPVVAGLAALVVLGAAGSAAWIGWQTARAAGEYRRAQQNLDLAYQVLDELYLNRVEKRREARQALSADDRRLLLRMQEFYQRFAEGNGRDPATRLSMAKAYRRVSDIHFALGEYAGAERANADSLRVLEALAAEFPADPDYQFELNAGRINWGHALLLNGHLAEAERAYGRTAELCEARLQSAPGDAGARRGAAAGHLNRANPLGLVGRVRESEEASRAAIRLYRELAATFPGDGRYVNALLTAHLNLGEVLTDGDRLDEAEENTKQMLRLVEDGRRFPTYLGDGIKEAQVHAGAALTAWLRGRIRDADGHCATGQALIEPAYAREAENPAVAPVAADLRLLSGLLLRPKGRVAEAEVSVRRALDPAVCMVRLSPGFPDFPAQLARIHAHHGDLLRALGRAKDADTAYGQARQLLERLTADFPQRVTDRSTLGWVLDGQTRLALDRGEPDAAAALLDEALRSHQAAHRSSPRHGLYGQRLGDHWQVRGLACLRRGDDRGALAAVDAAERFRPCGAADWLVRALAHGHLGERDRARACYDRAAAAAASVRPPDDDIRRGLGEAAGLLGVNEPPAKPNSPKGQ